MVAVNGAAVAGGCILACRVIGASWRKKARIGASELAVGVPFPVAALEILRHACGRGSEDLVFSARLLDAPEALALHMVHEVHPGDALLDRAMAVAAELATRAPLAYRLAKEQLRRPTLERIRNDSAEVDRRPGRVGGTAHRTASA